VNRIIRNLSYDDYVKIPALRYSDAKGFVRSALHARHDMTHPRDHTSSTLTGVALHTAVLEPEKFSALYAVAPKLDKRTTKGKEAWDEVKAKSPSLLILRDSEYENVRGMAAAIKAHPFIQAALEVPKFSRELTLVWDETVDGVATPCKCRIDWIVTLDGVTYVIDLKSTQDASVYEFGRSIHKFKYHGQSASYLRGLQAVAPITALRRWVWVAVENTAPHGVALYEPSEGLLTQGLNEYLSAVRQYADAVRTNSWPGYPAMITPIDLPRWAWKDEEVA